MSAGHARSTVAGVIGEAGQAWSQLDDLRRLVGPFALVLAIVAAIADPASAGELIVGAIPVAALAAWSVLPAIPLAPVSLAVVVPVVLAQRSGGLEPLMFEASLLAFVVGRWSPSTASAAALGLLAVACPVAVSVVQDPPEISVGIWILGILFPWVIARAVVRQSELTAQLEATRRELAAQALLEERRRIARDVHDLVGHGLAAVMLQITSARHVLRRDPDAAEEALRSAEELGRRSMGELRGTVALLRRDDESGVSPPLPSAGEIAALVDRARAGGLAVELRMRGDVTRVAPGVGVALYRIAQEALANAARHAPRARTVLGLELTDGHVELVADTTGPTTAAPPGERERPRYGLIGMRERTAALRGEFAAGPTPEGWRVTCRLPLDVEGR
jgi:signal transduction histidine kinase